MATDKDWTGGFASVFKTLGASNHTDSERQSLDYYATDPVAIDRLLTTYDIPQFVWECACGEGYLSKRLVECGRTVYSSDLVQRGGYPPHTHLMDFLKQGQLPRLVREADCCILTNPPYKYATEFIEHALELLPVSQPAIMLLKTTALEGKGRWERLYSKGWLHAVYQFRGRVLCAKNGDFGSMREVGSAVSYAWFVFKRTPCAAPTIHWI